MGDKIEVRCPSCNVKINAPVALLGKKAKCPRCQNVFDIVMPDEPQASTKPETVNQEPLPKKPQPQIPSPTPRRPIATSYAKATNKTSLKGSENPSQLANRGIVNRIIEKSKQLETIGTDTNFCQPFAELSGGGFNDFVV